MVKDDINIAINFIKLTKSLHYLENYFSRIYPFTTENLNGYLPQFNYHNKHVLTTGSSADQIFNLISCKANKITHLDINPFVRYYYNLKKAALLTLNRQKYIEFFSLYSNMFTNKNHKLLNRKTFDKVEKQLDSETIVFWQSLFDLFNNQDIGNNLFIQDRLSDGRNAKQFNTYLRGDNYHNLRKLIGDVDVNFITSNVTKISNYNDKYDYIFLSNILDYLYNLYIKDSYEISECEINYKNFVGCMSHLLSDDGKLFFHYFWKTDENEIYQIVKSWFNNNARVSNITFNSVKDTIDSVLVYQKK